MFGCSGYSRENEMDNRLRDGHVKRRENDEKVKKKRLGKRGAGGNGITVMG